MIQRIIYSFFLLMISTFLQAQQPIVIGYEHKIQSNILNEEREYWIHFPESYSNDNLGKANYPVIYLLDGENNFHSLVGIQKNLTRGVYNYMPESIMVGVVNIDRNRDFTPSNSFVERNGKKSMTTSGGGEAFLSFLTDELQKEINTKYRTSGYNILIGHSLGGLFAINTLLHYSDAFNAYISLDPSLWWDNKKVFNEAKELWSEKNFSGKSLFVGMAQINQRSNDKQQHSETINEFCTSIMSPYSSSNNLLADWKYYADESHGTITTIGMLDGLRKLFKGIELPVKQIPKNASSLEEAFGKLSTRLGHQFIPSETLVDKLAKYALSVDENENALKLLELNLSNYPDSPNAKKSFEEIKNKTIGE